MASRDLHKAEIFTQLLYLLWFIHCGSLACAVLYAGIRLLAFLTVHLKKFRKPNSKNLEQKRKLEAGMVKIRLLVFTICLSLTGFAVFLLLYGIFRDKIIHSVIGSYVLCIVWNFLAPLASFLGCLILVFDPRIDEKPTIKLTRSSSIEAISTSNQITSHMFTNSIAQQDTYDLSPGTLNADVFDALKEESQIHMNGYYQQGLKNNKEDGHLSRWSQSNLISPSPYETAHF
ncbi:hypothetical protein BC941DRAFT_187578 [Chlamydoabsidia padenii]|nr:hypothetical protein BC941DRAFT_187578 [Chlamydoabsidia padenii]